MKKTTLIFRLTKEERERLQQAAIAQDRTLTAVIRRALAPYITRETTAPDTPQQKKSSLATHND